MAINYDIISKIYLLLVKMCDFAYIYLTWLPIGGYTIGSFI